MRTPATPGPSLVASAVAATLLAGCSAAQGGTGVVEGGPVAYVEERSDEGMDALLEGTVEVSDSCVLVRDEFDQTWLPVFQRPRTTWDGTTLTYGGNRYTDGSRIRLGGGGIDAQSADYVPGECTFDEAFLVSPHG